MCCKIQEEANLNDLPIRIAVHLGDVMDDGIDFDAIIEEVKDGADVGVIAEVQDGEDHVLISVE